MVCSTCNNTGYKGRVALYEVMPFSDPLKELVLQGASAAEIKAEMIRGGVQSLRMAGIGEEACLSVSKMRAIGPIVRQPRALEAYHWAQ